MSEKKTLTILLTKGPYVSEAPDMAMRTALQAKRLGYDVNMFLYLDGTWVSHVTEEKKFSNPSDWSRSVLKRGIRIHACERCSHARDLKQDRIIEGIEISGSFKFMDMIKDSDKVITFGG